MTVTISPDIAKLPVVADGLAQPQLGEIGARNFHPTGEYIPITPGEQELTLLHRWQRIVEQCSSNLALEENHRALTYTEFNAQANRIAHAILARNAANDRPIALLFGIEGDLAISILGVWKAGNFFVWLEPEQPLTRNQYVAKETEAPFAITNRQHAAYVRRLWPDARDLLVIEELIEEKAEGLAEIDPPIRIEPLKPAYLMYTSGSTGKPKGTIEVHQNLLHALVARQDLFHFSSDDRVALLMLGVGYVFAMIAALMYGGCLLPFQAKQEGLTRFSQWLSDRRVTFAIAGAVLRSWLLSLDGSRQYAHLRLLCVAAGPTYLEHLQAFQRYLSDHCLFVNIYSATETRAGTQMILDKSSRFDGRLLPAGYPLAHGAIEIWDEDDKPQPVGERGEIVILSPYVAAGYWKSPELTVSKFGSDSQGRRYLRMGDLGYLDEQGCLWVLGRKDAQIKIRGNRVESAEIEVTLRELPNVHEAAVIHYGETDEDRVLVGFVAASTELTGQELRKQLATHLPDYMVPATIVVLSELPRNANGKVARPMLREMAMAMRQATEPKEIVFSSKTEARLASLVSELLAGANVSPHDNFFELGGHSLLAAQLMLRIQRSFGVDLPPRDFFAGPTVAALAQRIDLALEVQNQSSMVVQQKPHKYAGIDAVQLVAGTSACPPLFFIPAGMGLHTDVLSHQEIIRRLGNKWSIYGLVTNPDDDLHDKSYPLFATMDELVSTEIEALQRVQPHGPYSLVGICAGGRVAYEMARVLTQRGEKVDLLLLLDTPLRRTIRQPARNRLLARMSQWRRNVQHLYKGFHYHRQQLAEIDKGERTHYIVTRIEARLLRSLRSRSNVPAHHRAHTRYHRLIGEFEPTQPYPHHIIAILTDERYQGQPSWDELAQDVERVFVGGEHSNHLYVSADTVASTIRKSLEVAANVSAPVSML